MAGRLQREGHRVQVRHVAEVLAGMTERTAGDRRGAWLTRPTLFHRVADIGLVEIVALEQQ